MYDVPGGVGKWGFAGVFVRMTRNAICKLPADDYNALIC